MIFQSLDRLLRHGSDSCGILGILGILANGKLAMCGIGTEIPELTYGLLGKDKVANIWRNNPVLLDLRKNLPEKLEGVCAKCFFKNQCFGFCIAENYYQSQKMTAGFWFCEQAFQAGVFPKHRTTNLA